MALHCCQYHLELTALSVAVLLLAICYKKPSRFSSLNLSRLRAHCARPTIAFIHGFGSNVCSWFRVELQAIYTCFVFVRAIYVTASVDARNMPARVSNRCIMLIRSLWSFLHLLWVEQLLWAAAITYAIRAVALHVVWTSNVDISRPLTLELSLLLDSNISSMCLMLQVTAGLVAFFRCMQSVQKALLVVLSQPVISNSKWKRWCKQPDKICHRMSGVLGTYDDPLCRYGAGAVQLFHTHYYCSRQGVTRFSATAMLMHLAHNISSAFIDTQISICATSPLLVWYFCGWRDVLVVQASGTTAGPASMNAEPIPSANADTEMASNVVGTLCMWLGRQCMYGCGTLVLLLLAQMIASDATWPCVVIPQVSCCTTEHHGIP
jgi:hypothetical protein